MKTIQYKTTGATLEIGADGKLARKPFDAIVEMPFSEENLQQAESVALPGSLQILTREDNSQLHGNHAAAQSCICLADRATGETYEIYVEDGKLMMEAL